MNREYIDFNLKAQDLDREDSSLPSFSSQHSACSDVDFWLNEGFLFVIYIEAVHAL